MFMDDAWFFLDPSNSQNGNLANGNHGDADTGSYGTVIGDGKGSAFHFIQGEGSGSRFFRENLNLLGQL